MGVDGLAGLRGPNRCGVSTPPRTARPCTAIAPALRGTARGLKRNVARGGPCPQRPSRAAPIETLPRPQPPWRLRLGSAVARHPSLGLRLPPHFSPLHRPPFRARAFAVAAPVRAVPGFGPAPALRPGCGPVGGSALGPGVVTPGPPPSGCRPRSSGPGPPARASAGF